MEKPILVFKVGTASITKADGTPDVSLIASFARQIAQLHNEFRIVIVSSGAVGTGKKYIKNYAGKLGERKAAAAIGNPILINKYADAFAPFNIPIAQSLCERLHFSNRTQFLQLKETYNELWRNGIIPIANENDVVSNYELKFSDNDELATLIAVGFGAKILLIGTSVEGLLDGDGKLVKKILNFDEQILEMATHEKSAAGLGGMRSKLAFARLATSMGTKVVIFNPREEDGLIKAEMGITGTQCEPRNTSASQRKKWLAGGGVATGSIKVDKGAEGALQNCKSLLAVGVEKIILPFEKGDVIEIRGTSKLPIGVAIAKISSKELENRLKEKNLEVANVDGIVIL